MISTDSIGNFAVSKFPTLIVKPNGYTHFSNVSSFIYLNVTSCVYIGKNIWKKPYGSGYHPPPKASKG